MEFGSHQTPHVDGGMGMEEISGIKVVKPDFRTRRSRAARVDEPCVVLHLVEAGDSVKAGDPLAELCDIWGRPLGDELIRAEHDGFIIGRSHGIFFYPGQSIVSMSIRDEDPIVCPYPDDYFEE